MKVVAKLKQFPLDTVKDHYREGTSYYANTKCLVKKVNKLLDLPDPVDDRVIVYRSVYDKRFDEIVQIMIDNFKIRQHSVLTSKMAMLYSAVKFMGYESEYSRRREQLMAVPLKMQQLEKVFPPWTELRDTLRHIAENDPLPGARAVALAYLHGYVLRIGEIYETSVVNLPDHNWLDLDAGIWYIRSGCTKTYRARSFPVSVEFVQKFRDLGIDGLLICKRNGKGYVKTSWNLRTLGLHRKIPEVHLVRNSYETWQRSRTDVSQEEIDRCSLVLGHSIATAIAHYTPGLKVI